MKAVVYQGPNWAQAKEDPRVWRLVMTQSDNRPSFVAELQETDAMGGTRWVTRTDALDGLQAMAVQDLYLRSIEE